MERRLVFDRALQDRLSRLDLGIETVEGGQQSLTQSTSNAELIPAGLHTHHRRTRAGEGTSPGPSGESNVTAIEWPFDLSKGASGSYGLSITRKGG
jgi:hypothetical protein